MEKFIHNAFNKKYGFDKINDMESLNERIEKAPSTKTSLKESMRRKITPIRKILTESKANRYFISVPVGVAGTKTWAGHPSSAPTAPDPFSNKVLKYNKNGEFVLSARTKRQALERMVVFASKDEAQTFLNKLKKASPDIAYIKFARVSPRGTTVEDVSEEKVDTDYGVVSILHIDKQKSINEDFADEEGIADINEREIDLTESPVDLTVTPGTTASFLSKNIYKLNDITNPILLKQAVIKMIKETDEITKGNKEKTLYILEKTPTRAILSTIGTMISGLKV